MSTVLFLVLYAICGIVTAAIFICLSDSGKVNAEDPDELLPLALLAMVWPLLAAGYVIWYIMKGFGRVVNYLAAKCQAYKNSSKEV